MLKNKRLPLLIKIARLRGRASGLTNKHGQDLTYVLDYYVKLCNSGKATASDDKEAAAIINRLS